MNQNLHLQVPTILLVDGDALFVELVARAMERREAQHAPADRVQLLTRATVSAALGVFQQREVSAVITGLGAGGVEGLQFVRMLRQRYPDLPLVVVVDHLDARVQAACHEAGARWAMLKPGTEDELDAFLGFIRELGQIQSGPGFSGGLLRVGLPDLLQMLATAGSTLRIRLMHGAENATVHMRKGRVVHAVYGEHSGEPAFFAAMQLPRGRFELMVADEGVPQTITAPLDHLLMEGARLRDESADRLMVRGQGPGGDDLEALLAPELAGLKPVGFDEAAAVFAGAVVDDSVWSELLILDEGRTVKKIGSFQPASRLALLEFVRGKSAAVAKACSASKVCRVEMEGELGQVVFGVTDHAAFWAVSGTGEFPGEQLARQLPRELVTSCLAAPH
jgi:CheY-like chemotaxis protein